MAPLSNLKKKKGQRVLGIDASSHSIAWCVYANDRPEKWGKFLFEGADFFERLGDVSGKVREFGASLDVDYIVFEGAIYSRVGRNPDVTIKLAMIYGAAISELMRTGIEIKTITPVVWQSYLGNKNFTKAEKEELKKQFPGKSASYYTNKIRKIRKQRTMDYFNERWPDMNLTDNDIGDSCGLAHFAYHELTHR